MWIISSNLESLFYRFFYFVNSVYKKKTFIIILSVLSCVFGRLVSPTNGDELNHIHILFEWDQQPDAIGYNLQVSTSEFFNNLILDVDESYTVHIDTNNFNWDDHIIGE